jgi:hypothetical protein
MTTSDPDQLRVWRPLTFRRVFRIWSVGYVGLFRAQTGIEVIRTIRADEPFRDLERHPRATLEDQATVSVPNPELLRIIVRGHEPSARRCSAIAIVHAGCGPGSGALDRLGEIGRAAQARQTLLGVVRFASALLLEIAEAGQGTGVS